MPTNVKQLVRDGAERVLARAGRARSLDADALAPRLRATVEKYLLRHSPEASAREVGEFLDTLHADELLLVAACERGDGSPAGKLAYYSGCGSLGGWLRAVVGQLAVDRHRRTSRLVQTEEASEFDRAAAESHEPDGWRASAPPDPESALAERDAASAVEDALACALGGLEAEDRLLVRLYYFDGLRLKEAGAVLGVHEATASRRLTRLHSEIRKRVETTLAQERKWTREEIARTLAEAARAQTDADLRSMLAAEAMPTGETREELFE